jgi:hypothetical protein
MLAEKLPGAQLLYIYNYDGEWQALIDEYIELIWTISDKPGNGSFELVVAWDSSVLEWARAMTFDESGQPKDPGNIICADIYDTGDPNFMQNCVPMMIESVLEDQSEDDKMICYTLS